eukprot:COSAG05_NODE_572_length_8615_cov_58.796031_10_plen_116_part_00
MEVLSRVVEGGQILEQRTSHSPLEEIVGANACAGWASGELLRAHYAELARLAHTRAMAAFAPALTPMLATPPARMFAATNMLVCVLLLLHFCSEPLFPLCSGRSRRMRSCQIGDV